MAMSDFEIITGARLHFGLLGTTAPFGGVGAMLNLPATRIRVRPSPCFVASGFARQRVVQVAQRFAAYFGTPEPPRCRVEVVERPDPHTGLGSGTQLAMAVAESLCVFSRRRLPRLQLAVDIAGRGLRSAVGCHGYFEGGLIYESAGEEPAALNTVRCRIEIPAAWHAVLFRPAAATAEVAGEWEQASFARLPRPTPAQHQRLVREVEDELLPAAAAGDFERWSEAVYSYNRHSGNLFAAVQGGPYNGPSIEASIDRLRRMGVHGVGQSSWGPTIFAFCETKQRAAEVKDLFGADAQTAISQFSNCGRQLHFSTIGPGSAPSAS